MSRFLTQLATRKKKIRIIGEVGIKAVQKERFYITLPTPKMSS